MTKAVEEVISEFNKLVNMSVEELEEFLKTEESQNAGWGEGEESVGHNSGRNIVDILKNNPEKKPESYDESALEHMRKVVAYCNRHIQGELSSLESKTADEVKQAKSYLSLKNWGHDVLKYLNKGDEEKTEEKPAEESKEEQPAENKEEQPTEQPEPEQPAEEQKEDASAQDDKKDEEAAPAQEEEKKEETPADAPDAAEAQDDGPAPEEQEDTQNTDAEKRKTDAPEQEASQKAQKTENTESAPTRRSTRGAKPIKSYNEDEDDE
ncbi:hypothetical protein E3Q22_03303 [Wallemia mellicola]|uniref:Uncharacterized protein n=2 Tax=Wallemia mellicola TaxID=1708541 RepID=A0A4T0PME3_9BASI|nr:hypothetical protein WALSEDRAFT_28524 [Wallemia mellicola CBS 633.66]TIB76882.1 hypothetical protein E3Q22_03303 [Wallemia mellicola]EIM21821.1 hypothetical protein WALSEDRAFT_28524 [Wallemia mellicola CBS 633.66]TIB91274.1 hypothetical protein E3Q19_02445 [Wallemia mellicola]TIC04524.1 hypothetical protein E3Q16_02654 [Wallemia mellicola]TIC11238.1 hypothetical protein E3Q15_02759 [Wallemia mellicola]|eukprot:XP_006958123.1 hypothetical protein WALSEDRAFT_28524 [Wallemia mellicola CBS 633.66]